MLLIMQYMNGFYNHGATLQILLKSHFKHLSGSASYLLIMYFGIWKILHNLIISTDYFF